MWIYWPGCWNAPTHGCDPTTAWHGNFWLLGFPPGPFRSSLDNLDLPDSSNRSMSMPSLVRTPVQRKRRSNRTPGLKPATTTSLPDAGLQVCATYPAEKSCFCVLKCFECANKQTFIVYNVLSTAFLLATFPLCHGIFFRVIITYRIWLCYIVTHSTQRKGGFLSEFFFKLKVNPRSPRAFRLFIYSYKRPTLLYVSYYIIH